MTADRRWRGRCSGGFTLIEVMIALLVLSIGLLGLAALQTVALRTGQTAEMRTRATLAAVDMIERMRANPAGISAGDYDLARGHTPRSGATSAPAQVDRAAWQAALARLPDGQGAIERCPHACGTGTGPAVYSVTVWWNPARDPAVRGSHCPPRTNTDLRCVRLVLR